MVHILLVEDNPGDILLAKEALKEGVDLPYTLHATTDGEEALKYLFQPEQYEDAVLPSLIFLDLNIPKRDGKEVLARIKADHKLKQIPVIIFSTSESERDILSTYELKADSYVVKPVDFGEFVKIISHIVEFWNRALPDAEPLPLNQFVKRSA